MDCNEYRDKLVQSLDRAPWALPDGLAAHAHECAECRRWLESVKQLDRGLQRLPTPSPSTSLTDKILDAVQQDKTATPQSSIWWTPTLNRILALAASVVIVVGAILWMNSSNTPTAGIAVVYHEPSKAIPTPGAKPTALVDASNNLLLKAGNALVSLSAKTAKETVGQGDVLVPVVAKPLANIELPATTDPMAETSRPLAETGAGVSLTLTPVRDSARRAVTLFLRDYNPMPSGLD